MLDISAIMKYLKQVDANAYNEMLKLNYIEKVNNDHS